MHNLARHSPRRPAFRERSGRKQFPFLVDPNSGREMFESYDIEQYLHATYGTTIPHRPEGA